MSASPTLAQKRVAEKGVGEKHVGKKHIDEMQSSTVLVSFCHMTLVGVAASLHAFLQSRLFIEEGECLSLCLCPCLSGQRVT